MDTEITRFRLFLTHAIAQPAVLRPALRRVVAAAVLMFAVAVAASALSDRPRS